MRTQIDNFCDRNPVNLSAAYHPGNGNLVTITQSGGGLRFQHDMTVTQAREMAEALVALADSFEVAA